LAYVDDLNIVGEHINTQRKNLVNANKEVEEEE
jgi:hypothetical protein